MSRNIMKKYVIRVFTLVNILFFSFQIFAQTDQEYSGDLRWGKEMKEPSNSYLSEILGSDAEGFYALRLRQKGGLVSGSKHIFL